MTITVQEAAQIAASTYSRRPRPAWRFRSPVDAYLNSITPLWEASAYALRGAARAAAAPKSFSSHQRLAREARDAARKLKKKK